jgi:hypothetical protein
LFWGLSNWITAGLWLHTHNNWIQKEHGKQQPTEDATLRVDKQNMIFYSKYGLNY